MYGYLGWKQSLAKCLTCIEHIFVSHFLPCFRGKPTSDINSRAHAQNHSLRKITFPCIPKERYRLIFLCGSNPIFSLHVVCRFWIAFSVFAILIKNVRQISYILLTVIYLQCKISLVVVLPAHVRLLGRSLREVYSEK